MGRVPKEGEVKDKARMPLGRKWALITKTATKQPQHIKLEKYGMVPMK